MWMRERMHLYLLSVCVYQYIQRQDINRWHDKTEI